MAPHVFEVLTLDRHNYPIWAMDIKVGLATHGFYRTIDTPVENAEPIIDQHKYVALYFIIRKHIHLDLKSKYLLEENPSELWLALKQHYEQQKAIILPEANYEWAQLRLQDFKTIGDYNHDVHRISAKLQFCEKALSYAGKIEKTLSTMLSAERILQQQYREKNFQIYSELIQTLLQAKRHHEFTVWNNQRRPLGYAPLPEVHYNNQNKPKFNGPPKNHQQNLHGNKKHIRNKRQQLCVSNEDNDISKQKNDKKLYQKCGCYNHITKKCRTPSHLVDLYLKFVGRGRIAPGQRYEAHFNFQPDNSREEVGCSQ
ncbi:hypothetical protein BS78_07G085200 [Paspalum vaginatum]|nr:hypothetical protein BS78_07G085200 [Paspalum vaginatum]